MWGNRKRKARALVILTAPIIYAVIIPLAILDAMATLYQKVCFPVYGIKRLRRGDYFVFDRHLIKRLDLVGKLNCLYCSYGNSVLAYVTEITSRTEKHWCPMKHSKPVMRSDERYEEFAEYGDLEGFIERMKKDRPAEKLGDE